MYDKAALITKAKNLHPSQPVFMAIFLMVRDIPFQFIGSRDIQSMLAQGVGTCNAKHMLLKELWGEIGYRSRYVIDKFNLVDFIKPLNEADSQVRAIMDIANTLEPYYHTYLEVNINNNWLKVDITFDIALAPFGFVVAASWDGTSDTDLPHTPIETFYHATNPGEYKKNLLGDEDEHNKQQRKQFFALLNDYIASVR